MRIPPATPSRRRRQSGSFILETLVSLLIFAIALVALLGLMTQALNQVSQSKARNDASYLAGELISEMWVSSSVNITSWTSRLQAAIPGATGDVYFVNCDCLATDATLCSAMGTARTGTTVAVGNPQAVTICITWTDKKEAVGSTPRRFQTSSLVTRN